MRISSSLMVPAVVLIIIGVVVGFLIFGGETVIGFDSDDTITIVSLLPAVFVIFMGAYAVSASNGYMMAGAIAGFGIALAYAVYSLDNAGLLVPDLVMSASDIGIVIIFIFLVIAVVIVVRES